MSIVEERAYSEERAPIQPGTAAPLAVAPRRGMRGVTGAVLLISIGSALLLTNLGVLAINWLAVLQLWPLILILVGLDMMLAGRSAAGSVLAALLALVVAFGAIFWAGTGDRVNVGGPMITRPIEVAEMGSINALKVNLELGAGDTTIAASNDARHAATGEYRANERMVLEPTYRENGTTGTLGLTLDADGISNFSDFAGTLALGLTNGVPIDLTISSGVGTLDLNLSDLQIKSVTIDGGVGNVKMLLPDEGTYKVNLDGGVGNVEITIPEGVEAQIVYDGGLGNLEIDNRFTESDEDLWETSGFRNATERVTLSINGGVGNVTVK